MPICIKHRQELENGVCSECEKLKATVTVLYSSNNPTYIPDYMLNLNIQTEKLRLLNERLKKLLKDNKCPKK